MNILLTGGAGFIATHTCVELCAAGHDVVIVDNYVNSNPEALRRVEEIVGHPVKAYEADLYELLENKYGEFLTRVESGSWESEDVETLKTALAELQR